MSADYDDHDHLPDEIARPLDLDETIRTVICTSDTLRRIELLRSR